MLVKGAHDSEQTNTLLLKQERVQLKKQINVFP